MGLPSSGDVVGGYRLEGVLGEGGMGRVFEARSLSTDESVALKLFKSEHVDALVRFKQEFRSLEGLAHPNVVRIVELSVEASGNAFLAMELVLGQRFADWVRQRTPERHPPNLVRLRRAMRQLVAGLVHVHRHELVHRDLKPSNVLITDEGRVVILDFGLIRDTSIGAPTITSEGQVVGTPIYMAPEQAAGEDRGLGPAADWYAVGVMLYECLSGLLPFRGKVSELMAIKRVRDAPDIAGVVYGVPDELQQLCMQLLDRDPTRRPSDEAMLAAFGEPLASARIRQAPYVGRNRELGRLHAALHDVRTQARAVVVRISGASGLGKSTLVRRFYDELADSQVTVLHSRCVERESVPYKGLDGIIDVLTGTIRRLGLREVASLRPRRPGDLEPIFPMLGTLWPATSSAPLVEPSLRRQRGIAALREVLARLGERRRLIVTIDDFQWADTDSAQVLQELLAPPDPPALLLILGYATRSTAKGALELLGHEDAFVELDVHDLELEPLTSAESSELLDLLTADSPLSGPQRRELLARSGGSPLLLEQLTRSDVDVPPGETADRVILRRVLELPRAARRFVELIAVNSAPLAHECLVALFGPEFDRAFEPVAALGLIRSDASGYDIAHAHLRELIVGELVPESLTERHTELAEALAELAAEPETIAEHWELAHRPDMASQWAELAAHRAAQLLAFSRAVVSYRRAIRVLGNLPIEPVDELRVELAEQLIALGEGGQAAMLLLEVASRTRPEQVAPLRRRAALLLLDDGQIDTALPILREQLQQLGEPLPASWLARMQARASAWLSLARVPGRHSDGPLEAERLASFDLLAALVFVLEQRGASSRPALPLALARARLLILAAGLAEPSRMAEALAHEASARMRDGQRRRAEALLGRAADLIAAHPASPLAILRVGVVELELELDAGRWSLAAIRLDVLLSRAEQTGASGWLRARLSTWRAQLRLELGHFDELRRSLVRELAFVSERGSHRDHAALLAVELTLGIYEGRLDLVDDRLSALRSRWGPDRGPLALAWLNLVAIELALARGDLLLARRLALVLTRTTGLQLACDPLLRSRLRDIEVRLAALELLAAPRARARRSLRRSAERVRRRAGAPGRGTAWLARALLRELAGDPRDADRAWRASLAAFEACGMAGRAAAVRMRLADAVELGTEEFVRQRIAGWQRYVETHAPSTRELPEFVVPLARGASTSFDAATQAIGPSPAPRC
jgi:hypothetical protein